MDGYIVVETVVGLDEFVFLVSLAALVLVDGAYFLEALLELDEVGGVHESCNINSIMRGL